ncbi:hypothetical protein HYZ78_01930 [Candidatus Microgenomates bacterium]|nr:hypothetical protein [Candidatus Microgenomates bacterium]
MQLAQIRNPIFESKEGPVNDPVGYLGVFLPTLINIAFIIAVIIFVFVLLWGGISWMTSGSDKQKVEEARSKVTNGIIGLFVVFFIFVIISVVEMLFGINIMSLDLGILKL